MKKPSQIKLLLAFFPPPLLFSDLPLSLFISKPAAMNSGRKIPFFKILSVCPLSPFSFISKRKKGTFECSIVLLPCSASWLHIHLLTPI